jgi:hypothetical protein
MQHFLSVIAAVGSLAVPQSGMTNNAPIAVSTCSVSDLFNPAIAADLGPPISYRTLWVTFSNTQDGVATKVTFDVLRDGTHSTVTERGHFSKGVPIEHFFDEYNGSGSQGPAVCTVAAVTFADGSTWTPPANGAATDTTLR